MITTSAIVIGVEGNEALVESTQGGGCGNCNSENGCNSSKLSQLFRSAPRRFRVRNDADAQVGAQVLVVVEEGALLRSAILMYMLPLALLLCGSIVGAQWRNDALSSETYSAVAGLIGLLLGFALVKAISTRGRFSALTQPVIQSSPV